MTGVMTTLDLVRELLTMPLDSPVMIAIVKYPEEFAIRIKDGHATWADSTDVECHPLETGEVTMVDGMTMITVELTDYDAQRHFAGG